MKKHLLLIAVFFTALFAQAQEPYTFDTLIYRIKGWDNVVVGSGFYKVAGLVEMADGDFMADIQSNMILLDTVTNISSYPSGDYFHKISCHGDSVTNSRFMEHSQVFGADNYNLLLKRNPVGEGYILVKLINNRVNTPGLGISWVSIQHGDEDLGFENLEDGIMVQVEDDVVNKACNMLLENGENVIVMYMHGNNPVLVRVGLDGTLKDKASFTDLIHSSPTLPYRLSVFNDTPREYAFFDWEVTENDTCLRYHVVDSMFNYQRTIVVENKNTNIRLVHNINENSPDISLYPINPPTMLSLDDGTWLVATQYTRTNTVTNGVCVLKHDKTTQEYLGNAQFQAWPIYLDPINMAYPIGLDKSDDGNVYFAYRTAQNTSYASAYGRVAVVKMDTDLNIIWQRYCLDATGYHQKYCKMERFSGGLVVGGTILKATETTSNEKVFLFIFHDNGTVGTPEMEDYVRPYAFWPNPVSDALHLEYSPDVTPAQIELYDLQGRLVRMQSKGLESVDMHGLTAGQYLMKVTMKDGKVYSDKVVKE